MKSFVKVVFAAILISLSATALAQCIPMNAPGPPRTWNGQLGCYVPQGTPVGVYGGQQVIVQQPGVVVGGGGINPCSALGALGGGTIGSLARNHTGQAIIGGALIGGILGSVLCSHQGQNIRYDEYRQQRTVVTPSDCQIDGEYYRGVDEATCLRFRARLSSSAPAVRQQGQVQEIAPDQVKVDQSAGVATKECAWVNPDTKTRHDKPENDTRKCIDFVKEVAGKNGYSIAVRQ